MKRTGNTSLTAVVHPWHTDHPATPRDRETMRQIRAVVEPNKGKLQGVAARPVFGRFMRRVAARPLMVPTVTYRETNP